MPTPRALRERRRGEIIAVARKLVAEEGLEALTIGALESRLDFSRGVITYHFKNKDDIVYAVLESAIAEINANTAAHLSRALPTTSDRVAVVLRAYVRGFVEHVEAGHILLSFWGRLQSDRRARKANAELYEGYRAGARRLIEAGKRRGDLVEGDPDAVAALLVGIVLGIAMQTYFEKGSIDPVATVDEAVRSLVQGLARRARARSPAVR
jgi:AcrR family transcriptional regulator